MELAVDSVVIAAVSAAVMVVAASEVVVEAASAAHLAFEDDSNASPREGVVKDNCDDRYYNSAYISASPF